MVEAFDNRMEFSNAGVPLVEAGCIVNMVPVSHSCGRASAGRTSSPVRSRRPVGSPTVPSVEGRCCYRAVGPRGDVSRRWPIDRTTRLCYKRTGDSNGMASKCRGLFPGDFLSRGTPERDKLLRRQVGLRQPSRPLLPRRARPARPVKFPMRTRPPTTFFRTRTLWPNGGRAPSLRWKRALPQRCGTAACATG